MSVTQQTPAVQVPESDGVAPKPNVNSPSALRVTAEEFVPSFTALSPTPTVAPPAGPSETSPSSQQHVDEAYYQSGEEYEEEDQYDNGQYDTYSCAYNSPALQQQQQQYYWQDEYQQDDEGAGFYDAYGNWVPHCSLEQAAATYAGPDGEELYNEGQAAPDWSQLAVSTAQAVQLLHGWYPRQPKQLVRHLYTSCGYDLQATLQILSELEWEQGLLASSSTDSGAAATAGAGSANGATARTQPRAGSARQQQDQQQRQKQKQQQGFSLQQELFPELPGSRQSAASAAAAENAASTTTSAAAAVDAAAPAMPSLAHPAATAPAGSSWARIASKAAASPDPAPKQPPQQQGAAKLVGKARAQAAGAAAAVPWVATGEAVAREYAAARAEARDHARVRNACFHEATRAFLAGNKALAKELSAKGKEAAQRMWEAHERASSSIFRQRNPMLQLHKPSSSSSSSSSSTNGTSAAATTIDLHGLHVREVQAVLPQQLAALGAQSRRTVSLIVGTGHHTVGAPGPRVAPAVEVLLQELGYSYSAPQPGLLRVQL